MKTKFTKIAFVIISTIVVCGLVIQSLKQLQQNFSDYPYRIVINFDTDMVPNKSLILAIESLKSDKLRNVLHSKIVRAVFTSRYLDGKLRPEFMQCKDGGLFLIESNNRNNAMELIALLQHYEAIKEIYLEERILMKPATEAYNVSANFPFANQWHLTRAQGINVEDAWGINRGRSDVIVAVLDGGVDYRHPNLDPGDRSRVIAGWDFGDNDSDPMDDLPDFHPLSFANHGTHVAGIIGAFPTATNQISGVMQNVSIMPLKMVRSGAISAEFPFVDIDRFTWDFSTTAFPSDVANSIDFAVNNGARVINLSYGFSVRGAFLNDIILRVPLLHTAIRNAHNRNVLVVASMGNSYQEGNPVNFPAAFHEVMAVGNTTSARTRSTSSSTGPHISISAPGTNIISTSRGGGTRPLSGTSMSAPVVAGVAGLVISQGLDRGFNLTNEDVRRIMEITADRAGGADFTNEFGHGIVNAYNALRLLDEPNMVFHWEARARNLTRDFSNERFVLLNNTNGVAAATYFADWYWASERVTFPVPFMETPTIWLRERESNSMRSASPNDGLPWARITNVTPTGFDVEYAAYFIRSSILWQTIDKWIPADRHLIGIAYTVVGVPIPTISGPVTICRTATYTLSNPNLQAASWSVTGPFTITNTTAISATVATSALAGEIGTLTAIVKGVPITHEIQACSVYIFGSDVVCTKDLFSSFTLRSGTTTPDGWSVTPDNTFTIVSSNATEARVRVTSFNGQTGTLTAIVNGVPIEREIQACFPTILGTDVFCTSSTFTLSTGEEAMWSVESQHSPLAFSVVDGPTAGICHTHVKVLAAPMRSTGRLTATLPDGRNVSRYIRVCDHPTATITGPDVICLDGGVYQTVDSTVFVFDGFVMLGDVIDNNFSVSIISNTSARVTPTALAALDGQPRKLHLMANTTSGILGFTKIISTCPTPFITGAATICLAGTYQISTRHSATWSVSNGFSISMPTGTNSSHLATVSTTGYNRAGTITAVVNGVTMTKSIQSCSPQATPIDGPDMICNIGVYTLSGGFQAQFWDFYFVSPFGTFQIVQQSTDHAVVISTFPGATAWLYVITQCGQFFEKFIEMCSHRAYEFVDWNYIVYPNPVYSTLYFRIDASQHFASLTRNQTQIAGEVVVFDMRGRKVLRQVIASLEDNFDVDVSALQDGTYVVSVMHNGKTVYSQIVMVQH